ncbi:MAG: NAD(P)/FAD-dependent oxidoreductase [Ruminococcaceae bacterium]|nr:NAD(P)/FAD-dependent oxidoreductase [Oscillospiraceae bacterium]
MMKYLIIGASAAGLACAEQIRKEDKSGAITVLTKEHYLPYSRPSISYYLKGVVGEKDMLLRKPSYYKANGIEIITDAEVKEINPEAKTVKAGRKTHSYDKLCLCTGSKPFVPPMKNVIGKENALTFLDLESTKAVKAKANSSTKAVVIGAGLIGMKAAEGLSKICKSVDVVELSPRILPSILDAKSSKGVKKYIEENGHIKFHLGDTVTEAKSSGRKITSVVLKSGKELKCDLLILAVGVRPETALAENAGLEVDRGIIVDSKTMQTSDKSIYSAGDCTVCVDMLDGSKKIIALWVNAVQQGKIAGAQMAGKNETLGGSYAVNAIDFYGLRICTCGLINASGEQYSDIIKQDGDKYKRLIFEGNRLVGFVLINSSENAGIYTSLIENQTDLTTLDGDITGTPSLFLFGKETRQSKLKGETEL